MLGSLNENDLGVEGVKMIADSDGFDPKLESVIARGESPGKFPDALLLTNGDSTKPKAQRDIALQLSGASQTPQTPASTQTTQTRHHRPTTPVGPNREFGI